jgi:cell division septum initiation protein DivIVA
VSDDEIEQLRKRIDRLEWLITIMRDRESADALKGALIDAQHKLEELLKKRNGGLTSPPLYLRVQAQRVASLARKSDDRLLAAELRALCDDLNEHAEAMEPEQARRAVS